MATSPKHPKLPKKGPGLVVLVIGHGPTPKPLKKGPKGRPPRK